MHGLGLALLHKLDGGIEAGDHLPGHAREFQGFAAIQGRVELRAVVQRAGVMNLDLFAFVAHRNVSCRMGISLG